jgi:phosphonate transport system ATP-binding protein
MIHVEDVTISYSPAAVALRSVTLSLRRGEVTVLLGPSGAGKSTLLRCMNGLVTPSAGRVRVEDLGDLAHPRRLRAHRRRTGMIFQSHQLIGRLSVLANVLNGRLGYRSTLRSLFPSSSLDVRSALHCLERVGLLDKSQTRADQLSGGERQRVGIARALVQEPTLLLADEPVASLDPVTGERILTLLHRICREDGLTAAISLHQVEYARRFADRIIGLRGGRVVFDGPPDALDEETLGAIYSDHPPVLREPRSPEESLKESL